MRIGQLFIGFCLLLLSLSTINAQTNASLQFNSLDNSLTTEATNDNAKRNQATIFSINIINFIQLVEAVERGNDVRAIVHFDNCQLTNPSIQNQLIRRLEGASTRFNFIDFIHAKGTINGQFRDAVTTTMRTVIESSSGEALTLLGHLSIFEDNTAIIRLSFFDLNQQRLAIDWLCNISNGHDDNGLTLFNAP